MQALAVDLKKDLERQRKIERRGLFSRLKMAHYYLGVPFNAKDYFACSDKELSYKIDIMEDELEDLEEECDTRSLYCVAQLQEY